MTTRTRTWERTQPEETVVEREERELPATAAGMAENLWVAAGVAGVVLAGGLLVDMARRWPLGLWTVVGYLAAAAFLCTMALYAYLRFGVDDGRMLAERNAALALAAHERAERARAESDRDLLVAQLGQANLRVEALERKARRVAADEPTPRPPAESRMVQVVRIIATKWAHGLDYTRERLTAHDPDLSGSLMTGGEWARAMTLIDQAGFLDREVKKKRRTNAIRTTTLRAEDIVEGVRRILGE